MARRQSSKIKCLYYITHINNLPSIIARGILSHARIEEEGLPYQRIYDADIVSRRRDFSTPDGKSLWQFANLYFQPRNPMLYRVINDAGKRSIAVVSVKNNVLNSFGAYVTTGNAANYATEILPVNQGLKAIEAMREIVFGDWWKAEDGSKRKIMAECLVPDLIERNLIDSIYVADTETADKVRDMLSGTMQHRVVPEPHMFFQPLHAYRITDRLSLVHGDMFFSTMQTLTISVNTVGVMGKGLASRTKYQFPDVYVFYEDLCREKKLQIGKPYIYKRESSFDEMLYDNPGDLPELNSNKWFLLFPTKKHWRNESKLEDIEAGLKWLNENYAREGVHSLALPALGCGLGGLEWKDVGPLMCKYLASLPIPVSIYLPREQSIPQEYLTPKYLLGES